MAELQMKLDLLEPFERLPYFTIEGFKQSIDVGEDENQRVREMLSRWAKRGHILRLKRGVYMTRRFYELHRREADFSQAVSAVILPHSYISLEYLLQRAGVLTEVTYPVSAVTAKNTRTIENAIGTFDYRHVHSDLYTGFTQQAYYGVIYSQASVAKALFDYFYLRPLRREFRTRRINLVEDLRLNLGECSLETQEEFAGYVTLSNSTKMDFILENLRRTIWQP
ncbi:MAG: hypothetical protein KKD28_00510 [Chloroflexi bacterium]|nr:hypothetical protein [Chloroflexota bacterium]